MSFVIVAGAFSQNCHIIHYMKCYMHAEIDGIAGILTVLVFCFQADTVTALEWDLCYCIAHHGGSRKEYT